MKREIMVAVDGTPASKHALEYVGRMREWVKNLEVVLCYIMRPIPPILADESGRDAQMLKRLKELQKKLVSQAKDVLFAAQGRLLDFGYTEEAARVKMLPQRMGPARDIVFEAEHGAYDACVLGRRGLSRTAEFFLGGVTSKVLMHADKAPLWLVDHAAEFNPHFLVAVDGSENALRAVDHLAFMLDPEARPDITLLHVSPMLQNVCPIDFGEDVSAVDDLEVAFEQQTARCMDDFYPKAVKVLRDGGFDEDRIEMVTKTKALGVARTVVAEAEARGSSTIVIGRRGDTGSKEFFMGSISQRIVHRAEGRTVWVIG